ncbi:TolC family protein, partial [Achromobacter xylosoxidans]|nr:TolC family protein [Achromobacter xylosoxidans]
AWWRNFNDPVLDGLVDGALARNNDLAAAAIRVRRAQLQAGLAQDQLIPQLSGTGNVTRARNLRGEREITRTNSAELSIGYEVDLWGKLSRQLDAAEWEALASEQDRQSSALSLVGTTATLYWQTAFINQRIASSLESIAYARKTQELVRAQYAAGGASALEVAEAEQTVASQQAAHALLVQQRVEYVNALAILFDGPPDRTMADPQRLPQYPLPQAREGVPAELLGRRPDLRAAELRLRESLS